jgi:hypothetical protein
MGKTDKRDKKKRHKEIAESMEEIAERAEGRKERGRDPFHADWQATLEIMLLMMEMHLREHPGQLLPLEISGQEEWEFYLEVQENLDLPPDTCAVLITPNAFKRLSSLETVGLRMAGAAAWERNAHSVLISGLEDRTVVMQVSLPGLQTVGIDVYEDGEIVGDYTFKDKEECLHSLTRITWTFFSPKGDWTEEQIAQYTENWFAKAIDLLDLQDVRIHEQYSYVHRPELLGLSPLQSVFKVIEATVPKQYDGLEEAIRIANEINKDLDLGEPTITKKGVLGDKIPECQAFLNRITVEIDQHLDILEYVPRVKFLRLNIKEPEYNRAFDDAAKSIYRRITNRICPESLKL